MRLSDVRSALAGSPPSAAALFLVLWSARGRFIEYDTVAARIRDYSSDYPSQSAIKYGLLRLRKCLAASDWPVQIEVAYGIGLRLTVTEPGWTWITPDYADEFIFKR